MKETVAVRLISISSSQPVTEVLTLSPPSLYSCSVSAVGVSLPCLCSSGPEILSPSAGLASFYGDIHSHI